MYDKYLLDYSYELRKRIEAEESSDFDKVETLLLMVLDVYIRDQEYAGGRIPNPFTSTGQRMLFLHFILRNINTIIDRIKEHAVSMELDLSEPLPPAASGLVRFLFAISLNVFKTINTIEAERTYGITEASQTQAF